MNAKDKEFWKRSKAKWQRIHKDRKLDVDVALEMAFKAAEDFGYYRGKAEATMQTLFLTMEVAHDDYYDLLISPETLDDDDNEEKDDDTGDNA